MNTHADKTQENKSQSVSSAGSQVQSGSESTFQFVDNQPEAIAQRKLHEMANNSSQVSQMRAFQEMANNSPQTKQAAQLQVMADNNSAQQQQPIQKKENNTGLPNNLKSGIEKLSGFSMDDVKVHRNSDKPAQLQAHAYAQGTNIHLGAGQEKHLPHEAWHVVQQKQGRVKPTMQMKGNVNVNDDASLEKEADMMGAKALQVQTKLKGESGNSNVQHDQSLEQVELNDTVQMVNIAVSGGTFRALDGRYYAINDEDTPQAGLRKTGARMMLDFIPNDDLDAKSISLVQTVNDKVKIIGEDKPERTDARLEDRSIKSGEGAGTAIDQVPFDGDALVNLDPRYTENRLQEDAPLTTKPPAFPPPPPSTGYSAHRDDDTFTPALLKDEPAITHNMTSVVSGGMDFEVAALAEGGAGGKFVGSVTWGWEINNGDATIKDLSVANKGTASLTFMKAADAWNETVFEDAHGVDHETMQLPLSEFYLQLKKMPVKNKRRLLNDKILYATNMQVMLRDKIATSFGPQKENLEKALAGWIRMKKSDEAELVEILAELENLDDRIEGAQF